MHSKNEYLGTGIGLAMCKKICENHGGIIYAESALGYGATFHVILPKPRLST
ncbi:MAG TPA: ATP-binding protein [Chryseosolibacter sp.]|nr:ATP-binding protein [Chryseosolibacter sp.]